MGFRVIRFRIGNMGRSFSHVRFVCGQYQTMFVYISAQHCCFVGSVGWTAAVLARFRLMMVASMVSSRKSGRCRLHSLLKGVSAVQSMMRLLRLSRSEWKEKIALRYFMASRQISGGNLRILLTKQEVGEEAPKRPPDAKRLLWFPSYLPSLRCP